MAYASPKRMTFLSIGKPTTEYIGNKTFFMPGEKQQTDAGPHAPSPTAEANLFPLPA
jgi:hypothetical protein